MKEQQEMINKKLVEFANEKNELNRELKKERKNNKMIILVLAVMLVAGMMFGANSSRKEQAYQAQIAEQQAAIDAMNNRSFVEKLKDLF